MRRAQGALEFTLITVGMMLLFATGIIMAEQQFADAQQTRESQYAKSILDSIETEIRIAHETGDGYQRNFSLPMTLSGVSYNLTLLPNQTPSSQDELILLLQDNEHLRFLVYDVDGSFAKGWNLIEGGRPVRITPQ